MQFKAQKHKRVISGDMAIKAFETLLQSIDQNLKPLVNPHGGIAVGASSIQKIVGRFYTIRYMDDIIIFCKNRYTLRGIIKKVYGILDKLKLAYSKTTIGKAHKEFDFLGYVIGAEHHSLTLSKTTVQRFRMRLQRLYEQRAASARVAMYVEHWCRWATSGLADLKIKIPSFILNVINNPDDADFLVGNSFT
jgi:hypothetical protein